MDRLTRQAGHRDIAGHRGHLSRHVPGHFGTESYRSVPKCPDGHLPWLGWKIAAQNKGFFNPAWRRNGGNSEGAEKIANVPFVPPFAPPDFASTDRQVLSC
jgi:hypothetical protein